MSVRTISQSFKIQDRSGGVFVTKLDLFFFEKSDTFPVTIQLREMQNGIPSSRVIPFSEVTLFPSQVNVSNDGTAPTTVYFDAPVFLQNDTFYCFTVVPGSNSSKYKLWIARAGENQRVGEDQQINVQASKQPMIGTVFLSDDNYSYSEILESDLKFILYYAVFDQNPGTFKVKNALIDDVAFTANATDRVQVGDLLTNPDDANKLAVVTEVRYGTDENRMRYRLAGANTFSVNDILLGTRNSANVTINEFKNYKNDVYFYNFGLLDIPGTSVSTTVKGTLGDVGTYARETSTTPVVIRETEKPIAIRNVLSASNTAFVDKVSEEVFFEFNSDLENVSPVLDIDKLLGYMTDNKVNSVTIDQEETKNGGPALARYITRKVNLEPELPAQDILVYITAHRPKNSDIYVYYKIHNSEDDELFEDKYWKRMQLSTNTQKFAQTGVESDITEYKYIVPATDKIANNEFNEVFYTNGNGAQFIGFNTMAIKIVLSSDDQLNPPNVKDLRVIATT